MIGRLSTVVFLIAMTSTLQAAECSASLREKWSMAFGDMMNFNRLIERSRNMGEPYDIKLLCTLSRRVPDLTRIANEYYPACDPISAPRDLAAIERLNELAARLQKVRCSKLEEAATRKKK